jgi:WD40 repeat protein
MMSTKRARVGASSDVDIDSIGEELEGVTVQVEDTVKSLQNLLNKINKRVTELKVHENKIEDMEETMRNNKDKAASILKLDLRGKKFKVYKDTLIRVPGTYFFGMLSSGEFQPDSDGSYFIDRFNEGFDRILEYLRTGVLNCEGLNKYEVDCVYDNLDYFNIAHDSRWMYKKAALIDSCKGADIQLQDGRLCGLDGNSICIYNMVTCDTETLSGHTDRVYEVIQLKDGRICSCSEDMTIKVWSVGKKECLLSIVGHTGFVRVALQLNDKRLCSGSLDRTIKVWNKDTGVCDLTINTESIVYILATLSDGRVCGGLSNGSIKLYNMITGACDMTLIGHTDYIRSLCVAANDSRLYSGSGDGTIKEWNIGTGICERTLEGHTGTVTDMVLLKDGRLCSAAADGFLKLWNLSTGVCSQTMDQSQGAEKEFIRIIQLQDGRLLSQNLNNGVYLWD